MTQKEWDDFQIAVAEAKSFIELDRIMDDGGKAKGCHGIVAADEELRRFYVALKCSSDNCSELGRFHDGDCSECPQGTIRARAGLAG